MAQKKLSGGEWWANQLQTLSQAGSSLRFDVSDDPELDKNDKEVHTIYRDTIQKLQCFNSAV